MQAYKKKQHFNFFHAHTLKKKKNMACISFFHTHLKIYYIACISLQVHVQKMNNCWQQNKSNHKSKNELRNI